MLARLRKVLMKKGSLSTDIINTTPGLPRCSTYPNHFDTLRKLYRPIGYNNTRYWDDLEAYQRWVDLNLGNAARLREAFEKAGGRTTFDPSLGCLRVNDSVSICFGVAKCRKYEGRDVSWTLRRRSKWPAGWIVAIRLGTNSEAIQDHILLPSPSCAGRRSGPLPALDLWPNKRTSRLRLAGKAVERFTRRRAPYRLVVLRLCSRQERTGID
jgi:hypothetical protein